MDSPCEGGPCCVLQTCTSFRYCVSGHHVDDVIDPALARESGLVVGTSDVEEVSIIKEIEDS